LQSRVKAEKNSKKKTFKHILEFVQKHDKFIITAHETPDGDALGSEYAMLRALQQMGKKAIILNADPAPRNFTFVDTSNEIRMLETPDQLPPDLQDHALVILDVNDTGNIGNIVTLVFPKVKDYFIIDHHDTGTNTLTANLILEEASSTGEILYQLFKEMGVKVNLDMARALYMAIVYDTGSFIYPKTSALTFSIAYELVNIGVKPNEIYSKIYETRSIASLVLQSTVLATLELKCERHVAIQIMRKKALMESGATYEEGHHIINIPLAAEEIKVSIFFKENMEGILRCSLRSKGNIDVVKIAQKFGGGGHKTAAGFKCTEPLEVVRRKVLKDLQGYFKK
jgi:phosphoesterase RecJ-like protein